MSSKPEVVIIQTGIANTASIVAGMERIGAAPRLSDQASDIKDANLIVLPGVGAFRAGMEQLDRNGLTPLLQERIREGLPTLAVCLGLQLLFSESEESPGTTGLSIFPEKISRFPELVRVPQLGWNEVEPEPDCQLLQAGYAYFANSYRATEIPQGWKAAFANHGGQFVAALERGYVLCCQFHPELSGQWGISLLKRWLRVSLASLSPTQRLEREEIG